MNSFVIVLAGLLLFASAFTTWSKQVTEDDFDEHVAYHTARFFYGLACFVVAIVLVYNANKLPSLRDVIHDPPSPVLEAKAQEPAA